MYTIITISYNTIYTSIPYICIFNIQLYMILSYNCSLWLFPITNIYNINIISIIFTMICAILWVNIVINYMYIMLPI